MFGLGIGEILLIAVVAVVALGPDKLPKAIVEIAKMFKALKKNINDAREVMEKEINIDEYKQEALELKKSLDNSTKNLDVINDFSFDDKPTQASKTESSTKKDNNNA